LDSGQTTQGRRHSRHRRLAEIQPARSSTPTAGAGSGTCLAYLDNGSLQTPELIRRNGIGELNPIYASALSDSIQTSELIVQFLLGRPIFQPQASAHTSSPSSNPLPGRVCLLDLSLLGVRNALPGEVPNPLKTFRQLRTCSRLIHTLGG
jgi:hypothetical protein